MRIAVLSCLSLALTGCSLSPTALPTPQLGAPISGHVHGGQQPISGAHIYLFAANTTGYGGNNIAPSASNASISLLSLAQTGFVDTFGPFVFTDAGGNFTITGDYTCTPGQQLYIYALGGNPGAGINSASGLLAALGNCPAAGNLAATVPTIWVNEVTTVAAAFSLAAFASDATHISSSGTALAKVGIANAFANPTNLVDISTGNALAAVNNATTIPPQTSVNTVANILASCVNSASSASSACTTLFANAKSTGATGTTPTDTATAAINIAHYPATNVAALFNIPAPNSPFLPTDPIAPHDYILYLEFIGGGLDSTGTVDNGNLAIDAAGNAWIAVQSCNCLAELSPLGVPLSGTLGYKGGGLSSPIGIAIDQSNNVWVANSHAARISKFSSTGTAITTTSGFTGGGVTASFSIAIDGLGNAWSSGSHILAKLGPTGTPISTSAGYTGGGLNSPMPSISIDGAGNVWLPNGSNASISKFNSAGTHLSPSAGYIGLTGSLNYVSGTALDGLGNLWYTDSSNSNVGEFNNSATQLSPFGGYTSGGFSAPFALSLDGAGNVFIASNGSANTSFVEFNSSGVSLSPSAGFSSNSSAFVSGIAVDGSGNVWIVYTQSGVAFSVVKEILGLAAPVITPIAAGLPTIPTSDGSSLLATRP